MIDGETLQELARTRTDDLPGSSMDFPFGPDYEVYKVRGRVFMLLTRIPEDSTGFGVSRAARGQAVLILKAAPDDAEALRAAHEEISPGYHMNKRHWITIAPGEDIDEQFVAELVTDPYRLVVAGLPVSRRPVNPRTFGTDV